MIFESVVVVLMSFYVTRMFARCFGSFLSYCNSLRSIKLELCFKNQIHSRTITGFLNIVNSFLLIVFKFSFSCEMIDSYRKMRVIYFTSSCVLY